MVGTEESIVILVFDLVLAGVLVWLVDDDEAGFLGAVDFVEGGGDGGGDFFGVVGVVGIDVVREPFEAATDAGESIESVDELFAGGGIFEATG